MEMYNLAKTLYGLLKRELKDRIKLNEVHEDMVLNSQLSYHKRTIQQFI